MRRVDALDGLRAIALVMVVVYHLDKAIFPAGHWGVMLFFVLSGYLITRTLCKEIDETGRVDLRSFWSKRLLRLYPALALMCLTLVVFGLDWRRTLPSLGMYANYARITGTDLGVLTHTWFVAVIAHFYLLWPVVMARIPRHRRVAVIGVLLAVAVAWRAVAIMTVSPGWVYNATDTNAAALLAGALLAVTRLRSWRYAWGGAAAARRGDPPPVLRGGGGGLLLGRLRRHRPLAPGGAVRHPGSAVAGYARDGLDRGGLLRPLPVALRVPPRLGSA